MPRPKVKAKGGEPRNTSSMLGMMTWRGVVSQIASRSRWKCTVPLAAPVVPEVKAISATSSAAVSQAAKPATLPAISASIEPGASVLNARMRSSVPSVACTFAASRSARNRASPIANRTRALSRM